MKTHKPWNVEMTRLAGCAAVLALGLTACSSTSSGYRKSNAAANSIQNAAAEVQAESRALDLTMGSLKDFTTDPQADLRRSYQNFSTALNHLVAAEARTEGTGRRMARKSAAYFQAWNQQLGTISFEHIRDLSQARKTEVSASFEAVNRRYQENQAAVQPLISYLQDLRRALGADLTTGGLGSLQEVMQNAQTNAAKVQTALSALYTALANSGTSMSSVVLQTAPASEAGAEAAR